VAHEQIQLQLKHPYKIEIREHPTVQALLERGFRIVQFQRVTDHEVLVTLEAPTPVPASAPRA
jgi:hypothetical protein